MTKARFRLVPVRLIKAGDRTPWWTAWDDAEVFRGESVTITVQYADGGIGARTWDEPEFRVPVETS